VGSAQQLKNLPVVPGQPRNQASCAALSHHLKQETSMLDLRLVAVSLTTLAALMSVAFADPAKDRLQEQDKAKAQSSVEARPVRVILPASWEPNVREAETRPTK
jgi:hypothetical protein